MVASQVNMLGEVSIAFNYTMFDQEAGFNISLIN